MITICKQDDRNYGVQPEGWDFPIEELPYLLEEHDGEVFKLVGNRLYEAGRYGTSKEQRLLDLCNYLLDEVLEGADSSYTNVILSNIPEDLMSDLGISL